MKVTRYPVDFGVSGWSAILPPQGPLNVLQSELKADYLIIGAGFAGLSAARRLVQIAPSAHVVVIDSTGIAEGPAGRNSGFMIDLPHELASADYASTHERDLKQIALNRQAIGFAASAAQEYSMTREAFNPCGKFNGAAAERAIEHNENYARHLDELGEPYELFDQQSMKKVTGTDFYKSGIFTPGTGLIQPAMYIRELARGLQKKASIFEYSTVTSLEHGNGNWVATCAQGAVSAPRVILATNGHIESFGFFKRQVFHVILYGSMTRVLNDDEDRRTGDARWGITPSEPSATTMRKISGTGGTRIVTRNQATYAPNMEISNKLLPKMAKQHKKAFTRRYPDLASVNHEYSWAGRLCLSRNSAPAFGKVADGIYSACCQNGLGTTRGTLAGMAAAELAVEGETELVRAMQEQGTPQKLPPAPLDTIGAVAFMRWSEFTAREEI
ncbi:MAG: NAD(P)/FAD-dependent oxidoreductase [Rhizobiaceae bacterium]